MRRLEIFWAYVFLTPTLLGLAFFSLGPIVAGLAISFTKWDIMTPAKWVGLVNYRSLLTDDLFWKSFYNTIYFTIGTVPVGIVISLLLALLIDRKLKGIAIFRTVFFLPVVVSTVAAGILWGWLFNSQCGLINYYLGDIGLLTPNWLADTAWAMPAVIIMTLWKTVGYNMVIFLAGLQDVPEELYEAASIDGANWWVKLRHITLPCISPTTLFVIIMSLINSFQVFDQTYIMTKGGPAHSTMTLVYYVYENGFKWFKMGYASAVSYAFLLIILVLTLLQLKYQNRWVHYR